MDKYLKSHEIVVINDDWVLLSTPLQYLLKHRRNEGAGNRKFCRDVSEILRILKERRITVTPEVQSVIDALPVIHPTTSINGKIVAVSPGVVNRWAATTAANRAEKERVRKARPHVRDMIARYTAQYEREHGTSWRGMA